MTLRNKGSSASSNINSKINSFNNLNENNSSADLGTCFSPYDCGICLSLFETPMVLSCGHSICKNCIGNLKKESKTKKIQCPVCRRETIINDIKINYALSDIIEAKKKAELLKSKEPKGQYIYIDDKKPSSTAPASPLQQQNYSVFQEQNFTRSDSFKSVAKPATARSDSFKLNKVTIPTEVTNTQSESQLTTHHFYRHHDQNITFFRFL